MLCLDPFRLRNLSKAGCKHPALPMQNSKITASNLNTCGLSLLLTEFDTTHHSGTEKFSEITRHSRNGCLTTVGALSGRQPSSLLAHTQHAREKTGFSRDLLLPPCNRAAVLLTTHQK